jgi:hypothetical protein
MTPGLNLVAFPEVLKGGGLGPWRASSETDRIGFALFLIN